MLQQLARCYALSTIKLKHPLKHVHKHHHITHFCQVVRRKAMNKVVHLSRTTVKVKVIFQDDASG